MGEIEEQVRELAAGRFGSLASFARAAGVNYRTLSSLLSRGGFATSRYETVSAVAAALDMEPLMLARGKLVPTKRTEVAYEPLPLFGTLRVGQSTDAGVADKRIPVPAVLAERHPSSFLVRVPDTAVDRLMPQGSYALVAPTSTVDHSGQPYAACIENSPAIVRRAVALANGLRLEPDSSDPTWRADVFDFADPEAVRVQIIGRVVWYTLPSDWQFPSR